MRTRSYGLIDLEVILRVGWGASSRVVARVRSVGSLVNGEEAAGGKGRCLRRR